MTKDLPYDQFVEARIARSKAEHNGATNVFVKSNRDMWVNIASALIAYRKEGKPINSEMVFEIECQLQLLLSGVRSQQFDFLPTHGRTRSASQIEDKKWAINYIRAARENIIDDRGARHTVANAYGTHVRTVDRWLAHPDYNSVDLASLWPGLAKRKRAEMLTAMMASSGAHWKAHRKK